MQKIMPVLESPCWYVCHMYMALQNIIHPQTLNWTCPFPKFTILHACKSRQCFI